MSTTTSSALDQPTRGAVKIGHVESLLCIEAVEIVAEPHLNPPS